ncbi:MAG: hypothetical protein ACE5HG_01160 [Candidatus Bathyarchaeia archaeon]
MPYYVYVLLCEDGSYYTGYAKDIDSRVMHACDQGYFQAWTDYIYHLLHQPSLPKRKR